MDARRIEIFGLKTWGNLGNLLAARKLAGRLETLLSGANIRVFEGERFCTPLADYGAQIGDLKQSITDPAELRSRYCALMDDALRRYPAESETSTGASLFDRDARPLADHFAESRPDIVVGAKGLLSRLCVKALRLASLQTMVINYVTNHGLIAIPAHRSRAFTLNLVPFEWTKSDLITKYGYRAENVELVGSLLSGKGLRNVIASDRRNDRAVVRNVEGRAIVVFANHSGFDYARVLHDCSDVLADIDVIFIAHKQPELLDRVRTLASTLGARRWRVYDSLDQTQYFDEIAAAARSEHSFLLSKSGPNTVLEAVSLGLPVLVHMSGLPMEDWVAQLVATHGLGHACERPQEIAEQLRLWITSQAAVATCKHRLPAFVAAHLDPKLTDRRLLGVFTTRLQGAAH
jgi:UDP-N-acetylglucosamine:LPS N-acetylglucosamine transferase